MTQGERFGIANTEYLYIGIQISVNTGISTAFGVFLRKQIELRGVYLKVEGRESRVKVESRE